MKTAWEMTAEEREALWAKNDSERKNEKPLYNSYWEWLNDFETENCSCSVLCD